MPESLRIASVAEIIARRGHAPCTPAFLDQDRSFGTARSRGIRPSQPRVPTTTRSALLVRLRRLGDSGWTQGNAEAADRAAARRGADAAARRPAARCIAAPTAAAEHAA